MDFKDILLVSDFDNTMTGERHQVPQNNVDAILEFCREGGAFTIASGRGKREWRESFDAVPFNAPLILSNGAVIFDTREDRVLYQSYFTEEQKAQVIALFDKMPEVCIGLIETPETLYVPAEMGGRVEGDFFRFDQYPRLPVHEIPGDWDKVCFFSPLPRTSLTEGGYPDITRLSTSEMDLLQCEAEQIGIEGIRSLPFMYEIPPKDNDKGAAVRRLQHMLGKKYVITVGDAPNDLAMLKAADYCFVPLASILDERGAVPEGAIRCVRCEEGALYDVVRQLRAMNG